MSKILLGGKTEVLSLDELSMARAETNHKGEPKYGIFPKEILNGIAEMADKASLNPVINQIDVTKVEFVDSPLSDKGKPIYESKDIRLAVIKEMMGTIDFKVFESEVMGQSNIMSCGIIFTEKGIQVGFGPKVKVCSNLCILGAGHMLKSGSRGVREMFSKGIPAMLNMSEEMFTKSVDAMQKMALKEVNLDAFAQMLGELHLLRFITGPQKITFDHPILTHQEYDTTPMLNGDLNIFTEKSLNTFSNNPVANMYEIYNNGTEIIKPGRVNLINLMDTNAAFTQYMVSKS